MRMETKIFRRSVFFANPNSLSIVIMHCTFFILKKSPKNNLFLKMRDVIRNCGARSVKHGLTRWYTSDTLIDTFWLVSYHVFITTAREPLLRDTKHYNQLTPSLFAARWCYSIGGGGELARGLSLRKKSQYYCSNKRFQAYNPRLPVASNYI